MTKIYPFHLKPELQIERERCLLLLLHSLNGHSGRDGPSWSQNILPGLPYGCRGRALGPSSVVCPSALAGSAMVLAIGPARTQTGTQMSCHSGRWWFYASNQTPSICLSSITFTILVICNKISNVSSLQGHSLGNMADLFVAGCKSLYFLFVLSLLYSLTQFLFEFRVPCCSSFLFSAHIIHGQFLSP